MNTYTLKCRFCQNPTGEIRFDGEIPADIELKIKDVRCSDCEILHGKYGEMEKEFVGPIGTQKEFEELMEKVEYKRTKFDKEVKAIKDARIKAAEKL